MRFGVNVEKLRRVDVCVTLRGAETRVPEQFLDRAQIGPALEEMRGERVAQRVRADPEP